MPKSACFKPKTLALHNKCVLSGERFQLQPKIRYTRPHRIGERMNQLPYSSNGHTNEDVPRIVIERPAAVTIETKCERMPSGSEPKTNTQHICGMAVAHLLLAGRKVIGVSTQNRPLCAGCAWCARATPCQAKRNAINKDDI